MQREASPASSASQTLRHPDIEGVEVATELELGPDAVAVHITVRNQGHGPIVVMIPPGGQGDPLLDADAQGIVTIRDQVVGDMSTMTPTAPLAIRGTVLQPGNVLRREATVQRPFQRRWPAGYSSPDAAPMPDTPAAVRYCLGIAELAVLSGGAAVDADGGIEVGHGNALATEAQRLLCTDPLPIPGATRA